MAKMRSPNYPSIGLSEAVELAQRVWDREKRSSAPGAVIVKAWGYGGLNGAARIKLAALKRYGLLGDNGEGDMRLTDTAMNIIHNQPDSAERLTALRAAA